MSDYDDYSDSSRIHPKLRREFALLPYTVRRYILAAMDDGITWRGEDTITRYDQLEGRTLFQNIVLETERMREIGPNEYRKQTVANAKRVAAGLLTPSP